jgi:hypothetical protein
LWGLAACLLTALNPFPVVCNTINVDFEPHRSPVGVIFIVTEDRPLYHNCKDGLRSLTKIMCDLSCFSASNSRSDWAFEPGFLRPEPLSVRGLSLPTSRFLCNPSSKDENTRRFQLFCLFYVSFVGFPTVASLAIGHSGQKGAEQYLAQFLTNCGIDAMNVLFNPNFSKSCNGLLTKPVSRAISETIGRQCSADTKIDCPRPRKVIWGPRISRDFIHRIPRSSPLT